ncbi:MAG: lipocalin family protein [Chitinophagaceae bacterium]
MNCSFLSRVNMVVLGCLCLAACSKSGSSKEKTKTELISSTSWKFSQAGIDPDNNGTIDIPAPAALIEPCVTDNKVTFKSDKSGTVDEGAIKCNAADPQTSTFTWSLSSNESMITFSGAVIAGIGGEAKIVEITDSRFVLSKSLPITGYPLPIPIVVVLVH